MNDNIVKKERTSLQVIASSMISSLIATIITTPLDVIKIHQQKGSRIKDCIDINHINKNVNLKMQTRDVSLTISKFSKSATLICEICNPNTTIAGFISRAIKKDGIFTLWNGLKLSIMANTMGIILYMTSYEKLKIQIRKYSNNSLIVPLGASLIARAICTVILSPIEQWKVIAQGSLQQIKMDQLFPKGNKFSAVFVTFKRDLVFSSIYWVIIENIRQTLLNENKNNLISSNIISASIGGFFASVISNPFDVIKTKRQLQLDQYQDKSSIDIIKQIYKQDGYQGLFSGCLPRTIKTIIACSIILTTYEKLIYKMQQHNILAY